MKRRLYTTTRKKKCKSKMPFVKAFRCYEVKVTNVGVKEK